MTRALIVITFVGYIGWELLGAGLRFTAVVGGF